MSWGEEEEREESEMVYFSLTLEASEMLGEVDTVNVFDSLVDPLAVYIPVVGRDDEVSECDVDIEGEDDTDTNPVVASGEVDTVKVLDSLIDPLAVYIPVVGRDDEVSECDVVTDGEDDTDTKPVVASGEVDTVNVFDSLIDPLAVYIPEVGCVVVDAVND